MIQFSIMSKDKKIIIANWKMNPESAIKAKELFVGVKKVASKLTNVQTVIATPFVYLSEISKLYRGHRIEFAAQDVFWEKKGSFTGEISSAMLKDSGATYVIVGHSERRALGEGDEEINQKVLTSVKTDLTTILCIGESDRDHKNGTHLSFLTSQLESALKGVSKNKLLKIIIAYEPIWAIGKSEEDAMKGDELHETVIFIRKILTSIFGKNLAFSVPILYGGSAGRGNTKTLLTEGMVDGLLVGHASLKIAEFNDMLKIAQNI